MKRLNPKTNSPFRKGHKRDDGWVFNCYLSTTNSDGCFKELWIWPLQKENKPPKSNNAWRDTLSGRLRGLIANAKGHSKQRNHPPPDVTVEDLLELWKEQKGLCAYTGWKLSVITGSINVVSLERKDSAIGYTKDNVLLVCWAANSAKGKLSHDKFIQMCCAVVVNAQKEWDK
jgi:hypothetical protein